MSRRGRKRSAKAKRYPNGHVAEPRQRDQEKEARSVGLGARERVYGLPRGLAGLADAGDALGRAYLRRKITAAELEAGRQYEIIRREADVVMLARQLGSPSNLDRCGGYDGGDGDDPEYVAYCQAIERRYAETRHVLLCAGAFAPIAVDCWVIDGKEAWGLLEPLRDGLQDLVKLYQIGRWMKVA